MSTPPRTIVASIVHEGYVDVSDLADDDGCDYVDMRSVVAALRWDPFSA